MRATACSPGQVLAALGRLMCKDREPAQRATGCPASLVGVTRCRPLRGLADSMLPDPGLRVLALGYTLSPAARAGRLDAAGPRAASTCPGLHAVARCAGWPTRCCRTQAASTCPGLHAVARCAGSPLLGLAATRASLLPTRWHYRRTQSRSESSQLPASVAGHHSSDRAG